MSRYFVQRRVRGDWLDDDDSPLLPPITVCDHEPVDTGLIDQHGDPIMRGPEPMGFHHPEGDLA